MWNTSIHWPVLTKWIAIRKVYCLVGRGKVLCVTVTAMLSSQSKKLLSSIGNEVPINISFLAIFSQYFCRLTDYYKKKTKKKSQIYNNHLFSLVRNVYRYDGRRMAGWIRSIPRVLRAIRPGLPDPGGLFRRPPLPLTRLHETSVYLGNAAVPGEVSVSPPEVKTTECCERRNLHA